MAPLARIWTILIMCLVIQVAVTYVFGSVSNVTSLDFKDAEKQCIEWTSREDTKTMLRNVSRQLACPCNNQLIQYDINFWKNGRCYEEFFFQDGIKLICCYSENGLFKIKGAEGSYILDEHFQQSIKLLHKLCCLNEATCILFYETVPFDNCKTYRNPAVARSWGDAHIQPASGEMYDFNGHGEYIFLDVDEGDLIIQCRLEYLSQNNRDATILTAFALKVNGSKPLELMLNRTTGKIVYNNTNDGRSPFMIFPAKQDVSKLTVLVRTSAFQMMFTFNGYEDLTIRFSQRNLRRHIVKGLAGNMTGGYMLGNDTLFPKEANATLIYDFGQSWRLSKSIESIFLYNDARDFTYYNRNVTKPRFPDDYLKNITNMFTTFGNHSEKEIQEFQNLCNVSDVNVTNRCLISIARTNRTDDAKTILFIYNREQNITNYLKDQKPQFVSQFPNDIRLKLNLNRTFVLEVNYYVLDNDTTDTLTYDVTTEGNITIEIDKYNGTLTLYVDETLRDYKGSILVGVTDKWGKTDHQFLHIQFCGCEHPSQCGANSPTLSQFDIQQTQCSCGKYFNGSFCEIKLEVCTITKCYPGVTCNKTTELIDDDTNPCGVCPIGYSGNGITCRDINECTSKTSSCQHICNNIDGSFTCSCENGYTKNGSSCLDIDECKLSDKCEKETFTECVNTPGNFSCACLDEFTRDSSGKCSFDTGKYVYIGQLNLTLTEYGENVELDEQSLKKHLHLLRPVNDTDFANVELINITSIQGAEISREIVIFGFHSHTNLNWTYVQLKLNENQHIRWTDTTTKDGHACIAVGKIQLFPEKENMLCKTLDKNKCDETTARCVQRNGESLCECQEGYKLKGNGPTNLCYDVNECVGEGFECSNNGACRNAIGNWTCDCPRGLTPLYWNYTTITCEETGNMLCKTLDENKCDKTTTRCVQRNGESLCECKEGYEHTGNGPINLCYDVDECAADRFDCSNNGTCSNIIGNWTCDCPKGFATRYWNYKYITCEALFSGQEPSNTVTIVGVVIGSFGCVALILVVIVAMCIIRRMKSMCQKSVSRGDSIGRTQAEDMDPTLSQYEDLRYLPGHDRLYSHVGIDNSTGEEIADRPQYVNVQQSGRRYEDVHTNGRRYENVQESAFNGTSTPSGRQYENYVL